MDTAPIGIQASFLVLRGLDELQPWRLSLQALALTPAVQMIRNQGSLSSPKKRPWEGYVPLLLELKYSSVVVKYQLEDKEWFLAKFTLACFQIRKGRKTQSSAQS